MQRIWGLLSSLLGLLTAAVAVEGIARGEVFRLASGGELHGTFINPKEIPRKAYILETASGIRLELAPSQVSEVRASTAVREEYEKIAPQHADTAEAQWQLAEWCRQNHLLEERKKHLRRVVELDSKKVEAWRALGYSQVEGRWMTQEEIMEGRGYVRYRSRWLLPQEVEVLEARRTQELAEREWFRKLKLWRKWLDEPARSASALERIRGIDDANALKALRQYLEDEPVVQVRLLYLEPLARMNNPAGNETLVLRTLSDDDREVRLTALDHLKKTKAPEVIAMYMRALSSKNNTIVNRAAAGLGVMGHEAAIGPLVDTLITSQRFRVTIGNPGGGMSSTFARPTSGGAAGAISPNSPGMGGLGGFSAGSSTRIVTQLVQNEAVLEALVTLSGRNFGYDQAAWRNWLAAQRAPSSLDPRRDNP